MTDKLKNPESTAEADDAYLFGESEELLEENIPSSDIQTIQDADVVTQNETPKDLTKTVLPPVSVVKKAESLQERALRLRMERDAKRRANTRTKKPYTPKVVTGLVIEPAYYSKLCETLQMGQIVTVEINAEKPPSWLVIEESPNPVNEESPNPVNE